jgi:hypothetical protein
MAIAPSILLAPTGQQLQLVPSLDPQTAKLLPANAAQYNLEPLLRDLTAALPLELQVPITEGDRSDPDPRPVSGAGMAATPGPGYR